MLSKVKIETKEHEKKTKEESESEIHQKQEIVEHTEEDHYPIIHSLIKVTLSCEME